MKLESLKNFQGNSLNRAEMNSVCGGKKIAIKQIGTMRYPNGNTAHGVYIAVFDTETQTYTYYDIIGNEVKCP